MKKVENCAVIVAFVLAIVVEITTGKPVNTMHQIRVDEDNCVDVMDYAIMRIETGNILHTTHGTYEFSDGEEVGYTEWVIDCGDTSDGCYWLIRITDEDKVYDYVNTWSYNWNQKHSEI